jgi:hypothetical protein
MKMHPLSDFTHRKPVAIGRHLVLEHRSLRKVSVRDFVINNNNITACCAAEVNPVMRNPPCSKFTMQTLDYVAYHHIADKDMTVQDAEGNGHGKVGRRKASLARPPLLVPARPPIRKGCRFKEEANQKTRSSLGRRIFVRPLYLISIHVDRRVRNAVRKVISIKSSSQYVCFHVPL